MIQYLTDERLVVLVLYLNHGFNGMVVGEVGPYVVLSCDGWYLDSSALFTARKKMEALHIVACGP